jgi:hypothetical protein
MGISSGSVVRRVVTGHDNLKSKVLIQDQLNLIPGFASDAVTVWQHEKYPAELSDHDAAKGQVQIYSSGSLIRVVDFPPKSQGHNHRTLSLDYGIILDNEMEMVLDDGSRTIAHAGDIVVQQAVSYHNNKKPTVMCTDDDFRPFISGTTTLTKRLGLYLYFCLPELLSRMEKDWMKKDTLLSTSRHLGENRIEQT